MEAALICCIWLEVGTFLYQLVPVYTGKRNELQRLQVMMGAGRIFAVSMLAVFFRINLIELLAINVAFYFGSFYFTRRLVVGAEPAKPVVHSDLQQEIRRTILRLLPASAFYAFQDRSAPISFRSSGNWSTSPPWPP